MINTKETIQKKLLTKWFWLYVFAYLTAPIWYTIKIILSWELTVSDIWVLYWVISLVTLVSSYNDLWFSEWIKYFLPKFIHEGNKDKQKSLVVWAIWIQIITSLLFWILFYLWADLIANNYLESNEAKNIIQIYSLFFISISFFQINTNILAAIQKTFWEKSLNFLRWIFTLVWVILLIKSDYWSLENISWAFIWWLILSTILSVVIWYKHFHRYISWWKIIKDKSFYSEIIKYSSVIFLSLQVSVILSQLDLQMIVYLLWTTDAWYYTNYLSIISIPFVIFWPILGFLLPLFSSLSAQDKKSEIIKLKEILIKYFSVITVFAALLAYTFSQEVAIIFFWETYIKSGDILSYSILFLSFAFLLQINFWLLSWIWLASKRAKIVWSSLILNFILNFILIKKIWVEWAALATAIWWLYIFILSEIECFKNFSFNYDIRFILKNTAILAIIFITINYAQISITWWRIEMLVKFLIIWTLLLTPILLLNLREIKSFGKQIKSLKNN